MRGFGGLKPSKYREHEVAVFHADVIEEKGVGVFDFIHKHRNGITSNRSKQIVVVTGSRRISCKSSMESK